MFLSEVQAMNKIVALLMLLTVVDAAGEQRCTTMADPTTGDTKLVCWDDDNGEKVQPDCRTYADPTTGETKRICT